MFLIKFGGSVITNKRRKLTFDRFAAMRLVSQMQEANKRAMVVHGAGSFGHIVAKEFELNKGFKDPNQLFALAEVQRDVKHLNLMMMNVFLEYGIRAISLAPSSFCVHEKGKIKTMDTTPFKRYFELGYTPVTFGDVVLDEAIKFSICSGDQLMLKLAKTFKPEKVIFAADVDGIFSSDPSSDMKSELLPVVDKETYSKLNRSVSDVHDVTGSIYGKLDIMFEIAELGIETIILNGGEDDRLKDALEGDDIVCTRVVSK